MCTYILVRFCLIQALKYKYALLQYFFEVRMVGVLPNFTKKAIKKAFVELLDKQPLNKISVRSIVEVCGINRNSFYYHFQDIPALIEEIFMDEVEALIEKYPTIYSLNEFVDTVYQELLKNKNAILNIFNSVNRDIFEQYTMKLFDSAVTRYVNIAFEDIKMNEQDKRICILSIKYELFGSMIEYCSNGLKERDIEDIHRLLDICKGVPELINEQLRNTLGKPK